VDVTCAAGQIALVNPDDEDDQYCSTYIPATFGGAPIDVTVSSVFKLSIPEQTGSFTMTFNSSSSNAEFYGNNYAGTYSSSVCNNPSGVSSGDYYIYSVVCNTPRTGDFFLHAYDNNVFNASVTFAATVCATGLGGFNCTYVAQVLNPASLGSFQVIVPYESTGSQYGMYYLYFDIPASYTGNEILVSGFSNSGSGYGYMRRSGYPTYSSYEASVEYDSYTSTFAFSQFEYSIPGRVYFGFDCYSSGGCNITVSALNAATPTTGSTSSAFTSAAVTSGKPITSNAVTSNRITSSAITSGSSAFTTNAVTSNRGITSSAVTSNAVSTNAVTSAQGITSNRITSAAVTSAAVTSNRITSSVVTSARIMTTGAVAPVTSSSSILLPVVSFICLLAITLF